MGLLWGYVANNFGPIFRSRGNEIDNNFVICRSTFANYHSKYWFCNTCSHAISILQIILRMTSLEVKRSWKFALCQNLTSLAKTPNEVPKFIFCNNESYNLSSQNSIKTIIQNVDFIDITWTEYKLKNTLVKKWPNSIYVFPHLTCTMTH